MTLLDLLYTDVVGMLRKVSLSIDGEPELLSNIETIIDGSSVFGFARVERSDLLAKPVSNRVLTADGYSRSKHAIAGIFTSERKRHPADPRYVAERLGSYMQDLGLDAKAGVEIEFYVVKRVRARLGRTKQVLEVESMIDGGFPSSALWWRKTYHSPATGSFDGYIGELVSLLEKNDMHVVKIHRENGPVGQVEVSSWSTDPLTLSDFVQVFKYFARLVGRHRGLQPIFLAKPFPDDYGSGMHVHLSLWRGGANMFVGDNGLSDEALYFIGGLLEHARSLAALTNPTVNSYRRLVEGFEAPVYISWGVGNRTTTVRVPEASKARVEYRPPDPTANPYLAISAIIMAGLDGIKRKISPGEPTPIDVFEEIRKSGLKMKTLPRSLDDALDELESDNDYLKPVFPSELIETYIEVKRREARISRAYPCPSDYIMYLEL